ncbi:MAG TPA: RIP metalloprotease [Candidatus Dormibacteraeota bacterium]|nr:RIP metalloprotease [Candidatus Dormibacteraeota bacterium]
MILNVLEIIGAVILVLLTVVLVHEGGHFVVGKLSGIRVDEFSVGFGPRLASRRRGETTYSLRAIPAGGYVRMAGMLGLEGEADAGERNFYRASIPRRLATIVAGIVANMLLAGLLFSVLKTFPVSTSVSPSMAASTAGLRNGDLIVSVDGQAVRHDNQADAVNDLHAPLSASDGRPVAISYVRGGVTQSTTAKPSLTIINRVPPTAGTSPSGSPSAVTSVTTLPVGNEFVVTAIDGQPVGTGDPARLLATRVSGYLVDANGNKGTSYSNIVAAGVTDGTGTDGAVQAAWRLGVGPGFDGDSAAQALADGFGTIPAFISDTYHGIANIITTPNSGGLNGPQGLSGPVGIVRETATVTQQGWTSLIYWLAFISMNLGFINLLPVPFLDGGKLVLILLEAARRRRLDPRREALIYAAGLALVVVFVIYVTIGDVARPQ